MCATNVEVGVAISLMALDRGQSRHFADFADGLEPLWRDKSNAFSIVKHFRVTELDLFRPYGTIDMYPVVPGSPLQWFARVDRTARSLLLHTPSPASFLNDLLFDTFLLAVSV